MLIWETKVKRATVEAWAEVKPRTALRGSGLHIGTKICLVCPILSYHIPGESAFQTVPDPSRSVVSRRESWPRCLASWSPLNTTKWQEGNVNMTKVLSSFIGHLVGHFVGQPVGQIAQKFTISFSFICVETSGINM